MKKRIISSVLALSICMGTLTGYAINEDTQIEINNIQNELAADTSNLPVIENADSISLPKEVTTGSISETDIFPIPKKNKPDINIDDTAIISQNEIPATYSSITDATNHHIDIVNGKDAFSVQNQTGIFKDLKEATSENIDPLTGNLNIVETDLVLPGVDGLDLRLERYYNMAQAELYTKSAAVITETYEITIPADTYVVDVTVYENNTECVSYSYPYYDYDSALARKTEVESRDTDNNRYIYDAVIRITSETENINVPIVASYLEASNYLRNRNDLGAGWSWCFPSVQIIKDNPQDTSETPKGLYFHDGKGNVYEIEYDYNNGYSFANFYHSEYEFDDYFDYNPNIATSYITYTCKYKNGTTCYFGTYGELLAIVDRYGNKISFQYDNKSFYGNNSGLVISEIFDTVGRVISFDYGEEDSDGYSYITVTVSHPNNTEELTLQYERYMLPITSNDEEISREPILVSFKNQLDEYTTYVSATLMGETLWTYPLNFTFSDKRLDSYLVNNVTNYASNAIYLLGEIRRPSGVSRYYYDKTIRNLGHSGVTESYRVIHREDSDRIYNESTKESRYNFIKNEVSFEYREGDYTGYPYYCCTDHVSGNYSTYVYTTEQDKEGLIVHTKLGDNWLRTYDRTEINGLTIDYAYSDFYDGRPRQTSILYTDEENNHYESYIYRDYYGDSDSSYGKISSQSTEVLSPVFDTSVKTYHSTAYNYNGQTGDITEKQWFKDENTLCRETYEYNGANNRLSKITDAAGNITEYSYEYTNGHISKRTITSENDGKQKITEELYTSQTNYLYPSTVIEKIEGENGFKQRTTTYTYDMLLGVPTSINDNDGNTTYYQYDKLGRVTKIIHPEYAAYSDVNNKNSKILPVENISYIWAGIDYPHYLNDNEIIAANCVETNTIYYDVSNVEYTIPTSLSFDNLDTTHFSKSTNCYLADGEIIMSQVGDLSETHTKYTFTHPDVSVTETIDETGNVTKSFFDGLGREIRAEDAYGNAYITDYNHINNNNGFTIFKYFLEKDSEVKQNVTEQVTNILGQVTEERYYNSYPDTYVSVKYAYDLAGNVIGITDANRNLNNDGFTESMTYDKLNRVITSKNANNEVIEQAYDSFGNVTRRKVSGKTAFTRSYDGAGNLITDKDAANISQSYDYNELGQLDSTVDRNGFELSFEYNSNNVSDRNITINYGVSAKDARYEISTPFGASKTYTTSLIYDETLNGYSGYVDSITDTEFSHTGNITEKTTDYNAYIGGINFEEFEKYSYDEAGRISSSLTGALNDDGTIYGNVTHYTYDKTRLSKVQLNGSQIKNTDSTVNAQYEFYADGKLKSITYPALSTGEILKSEYVYNSLGRLQLLTNKKGEVSVSSFAYEYDSNGNILKITETVGEETNVTNLTYDKLNRIKTVSGTKHADSYYEYDAYGNRKIDYQKQDFLSEESATYTYNELNQLESATVGPDTTNFEYGADGMRFLKQENNNLPTFYVYNLDGKLSEEVQFVTRTSSEETDYVMYSTASYIHGPDRTLAKLDNLHKKSYYYLYNGHGDVIQIIDTDGNIVNTYDYDIWGNFLKKQETIHNPFTYFGQTYDETTGLYYLRARYYDPTTGRFTQQDPAEDGYNWYAYGNQNPIMYADYTGEGVVLTCIIIGAVVGAVAGGFAGAYVSKKTTGNINASYVTIGVLGGATVGGLLGWGLYSFGASISATGLVSAAPGLYKTLDKGVNFAAKALQHMNEKARHVPVQVLIEAIKNGTAKPDPQGTEATMYTIEMVRNGTTYTLEVLYNVTTNTIQHFMYYHK